MSRLRPQRPVRLSNCKVRCGAGGPIWLGLGVKSSCCGNRSDGAACAQTPPLAIASATIVAIASLVGRQATRLVPLPDVQATRLLPKFGLRSSFALGQPGGAPQARMVALWAPGCGRLAT